MKKFLAVIASASLAVTMFAFTACDNGNGDKGTIKGDYKEPTADELQTALESIDDEKVLASFKGVEFGAKLDMATKSGDTKSEFNINLDYKLAFSEEAILGSGNFGVKTNDGKQTSELTASTYLDSTYVYADVKGSAAGQTADMKAKIEYGEIIEGIIGQLPISEITEGEEGGNTDIVPTPDETPDVAGMIAMLKDYKFNIGLDSSAGYKFKLSATEETFWLIAGEDMPDDQLAAMKLLMKFNSFVFDIYFAVDEQSAFTQMSMKVDIDMVMDMSALGGMPMAAAAAPEMSMKISGYVDVKAFDGAIALPEGIAGDTSYVDKTEDFGAIIGGIGGGNGPFYLN